MRKSFELRQHLLQHLVLYLHDITDAEHCADIHHIVFSFQDDGLIIEHLFFLYEEFSGFITIDSHMSEYADMQFLEILRFQIMVFEDFVPQKIVLAAIEEIEFRIFVILEPFMPVGMIGIDVQ